MVKQQKEKVVITGLGCLTSVGHNVEDTWQAICDGVSGVAPVTQWDASEWDYKLAAEIKNYDAKSMIYDRKLLKLISRQDVIGLYAANQAINHSGFLTYRDSLQDATEFNDRTGVYVGSPASRFYHQYDFLHLLKNAKDDLKKFGEGLFEQIHPMWLLRILPNNVLAYVGIQHGFKGPNHNVTNHIVSGTQAIAEAYHALQQGIADRAVVVAYESAVEPEAQINYGEIGILSKNGLHPFDESRDGTILAEGAGALIIETLSSAQKRGATIYGEILSEATTNEAMGIFPIRDDGDGLARAMELALQKANITPNDVGMITAHGNGTKNSDESESSAIQKVFADNTTPVTAFKWSLGHSLCAAGVLETVVTVQALQQHRVPGIATLVNKAKDCGAINVNALAQTPKSSIALINTRGFGSINSCLVINSEVL